MVDIESPTISFWGYTAVAAHPVALPNNLCSLFPKGVINRIRVFTEVFTNVAVDILAAVPKLSLIHI